MTEYFDRSKRIRTTIIFGLLAATLAGASLFAASTGLESWGSDRCTEKLDRQTIESLVGITPEDALAICALSQAHAKHYAVEAGKAALMYTFVLFAFIGCIAWLLTVWDKKHSKERKAKRDTKRRRKMIRSILKTLTRLGYIHTPPAKEPDSSEPDSDTK